MSTIAKKNNAGAVTTGARSTALDKIRAVRPAKRITDRMFDSLPGTPDVALVVHGAAPQAEPRRPPL